MAEPIWPHPTRTSVPAFATAPPLMARRRWSSLADRVDHRHGHRLFRRFAAPDHQLERRIEALAFREGDIDQILDLLGARGADAAQQYGVTERWGIIPGREIEMAEPHLFVGQCQQL